MAKDTTTGRKYRGYTINNGQDGNLHCHTNVSDGKRFPQEKAKIYKRSTLKRV